MTDDFSGISSLLQQTAEETRKKKEEQLKTQSSDVEDIFSDWDFSDEDDSFDELQEDIIPFDTALSAFKKKKKGISPRQKIILIALISGAVAGLFYLIVLMPLLYNFFIRLTDNSVKSGNMEQARKRFKIFSIFSFNSRQSIADYIDILLQNEILPLSKQKIDFLLNTNPRCELGLDRLIRYYILTDNLELAEETVNEYITIHRDNHKTEFYRAEIAYKRGKISEAINHYIGAYLMQSDFIEAYLKLRRLYVETEDWDKVFEMQKYLDDIPNAPFEDYDYYYDLGHAYYNYGISNRLNDLVRQAERYFIECTKFRPNEPQPWWKLGLISEYTAAYSDAALYYTEYKKLRPNDSQVYVKLGIIYYKANNIKESVRNFQQAITINPQEYEAYYYIGNLFLYEFENYQNAIINYHISLQGDVIFSDIYFQLATAYFYNGEYENAIDYYKRYLSENENDIDTLYNLSLAYIMANRYNEAISNYEKLISINEPNARIYNNLGVIYEINNAEESALRNYWNAVEYHEKNNKLRGNTLSHNNFKRFMSKIDFESVSDVLYTSLNLKPIR